MKTYSVESDWGDDLDVEEFKEMADRIWKERKEYEDKVIEYVSRLRCCPLIKKMYGSMYGAFNVDSRVKFDYIYRPDIDIKYKEDSNKNNCFFNLYYGAILSTPIKIWSDVIC